MATKVQQTYTPALNFSLTTRDGQVTRLTTWVSGGTAKDTEVLVDVPRETFRRR